MSRRVGQNGNVYMKPNCKLGRCEHKKSLCPKHGRYWQDVSGKHERRRVVIPFGEVTQSVAERKLREHIEQKRSEFATQLHRNHFPVHHVQDTSNVVAG
jgi:hypothetical protein